MKFWLKFKKFNSRKCKFESVVPQKWRPFVTASMCQYSCTVLCTSLIWLLTNRAALSSRQINSLFNTLRPGQNRHHFPDDIFKLIFLNENVWISINISLKFVPKGPINNIPALVQIMAWRRLGDKSLSEPVMVSLLTHKWVTRPQWVNMIIN